MGADMALILRETSHRASVCGAPVARGAGPADLDGTGNSGWSKGRDKGKILNRGEAAPTVRTHWKGEIACSQLASASFS